MTLTGISTKLWALCWSNPLSDPTCTCVYSCRYSYEQNFHPVSLRCFSNTDTRCPCSESGIYSTEHNFWPQFSRYNVQRYNKCIPLFRKKNQLDLSLFRKKKSTIQNRNDCISHNRDWILLFVFYRSMRTEGSHVNFVMREECFLNNYTWTLRLF